MNYLDSRPQPYRKSLEGAEALSLQAGAMKPPTAIQTMSVKRSGLKLHVKCLRDKLQEMC